MRELKVVEIEQELSVVFGVEIMTPNTDKAIENLRMLMREYDLADKATTVAMIDSDAGWVTEEEVAASKAAGEWFVYVTDILNAQKKVLGHWAALA